jgi:hypothetical protein
MSKPSWFDWLTVAAIVLGPILALLAQRALDSLREKRRQRLAVYFTLMGTRANYLAPEHVRALNSIDVVFAKKRDKRIRDAWQRVLEHVATPVTNPGWDGRYFDLKIDLLQAMGAAVGYNFTTDYLRRQIYTPVRHAQVEQEMEQIRQALVKILTENGVKIIPGDP